MLLQDVICQELAIAEYDAASRAWITSDRGVSQQMLLQRGLLGKPHSAEVAFEWFFAFVE